MASPGNEPNQIDKGQLVLERLGSIGNRRIDLNEVFSTEFLCRTAVYFYEFPQVLDEILPGPRPSRKPDRHSFESGQTSERLQLDLYIGPPEISYMERLSGHGV